ncbi:adenylate/guanylate cyclase domain-containing protein [uncultured Croceitalea sp.]|uniref:adenylate/guanylate cyclase domain-containing protein n=1 Tax=uncultured Croceitalea sp. TaxID=1798908 RepID=UPI003305FD83
MKVKNRNLKEYLNHLGLAVFFWTLAMTLYAVFRYYGLREEPGISISAEYAEFYVNYKTFVGFAVFGFLLGICYATIEFSFEKYVGKRISIGLNILIQFVLITISVILISIFLTNIVSKINGLVLPLERGWWYKDTSFRSLGIYIIFCSFIFTMMVIAKEKFGDGVLLGMLLGKYKHPKEEERIFMFLDLKSSTAIAEELGHFKYSQLIQDCFYDMNEITQEFQAQIYQYVGDEIVLTWPYEKGLAQHNAIALFFAFQEKLTSKRAVYEKKYQLLPEFKAGLHGGKLMVAEVGVVKKELAYHGDVINTTARIQGACNENKVKFLISEKLLNDFEMKGVDFVSKPIGKVQLKGKRNPVNIHALKALV